MPVDGGDRTKSMFRSEGANHKQAMSTEGWPGTRADPIRTIRVTWSETLRSVSVKDCGSFVGPRAWDVLSEQKCSLGIEHRLRARDGRAQCSSPRGGIRLVMFGVRQRGTLTRNTVVRSVVVQDVAGGGRN